MAAKDYIEIKDLVNDIMLMLDEDSYDKNQQFHRLNLLALQGLKELTFDVTQEVKSIEMLVDSSTYTVTLPDDFVGMNKLGLMGGDNKIHPLTMDNNLSLDSSYTSQDSNEDLTDSPFYANSIGGKYGIGGGGNRNGHYRLNRNDNTIQFSSDVSGKTVVMEYISNGLSTGSNRVVELLCKQGSDINDGEMFSLGFYDSVSGAQSNWRVEWNSIPDTISATSEDYVGFNSGNTSDLVAEKVAEALNTRSPYHSATASGDVVTVTYNQLLDWTVFETDVSDTFESTVVVNAGSAGSGPKIPQMAEEALRSYIYWKCIQRKRGVPLGEKQIAKKDYYNQKRLARARMMNFSKEDAIQVSRKNFKQSPKF